MEIKDLIAGLNLTVNQYAKEIYDWDLHNAEQKQIASDTEKKGGYLKVFSAGMDTINYDSVCVLEAKTVNSIFGTGFYDRGPKFQELFEQLKNTKFYFIQYIRKDKKDKPLYPNTIFSYTKEGFDDAVAFARACLKGEIAFEYEDDDDDDLLLQRSMQ